MHRIKCQFTHDPVCRLAHASHTGSGSTHALQKWAASTFSSSVEQTAQSIFDDLFPQKEKFCDNLCILLCICYFEKKEFRKIKIVTYFFKRFFKRFCGLTIKSDCYFLNTFHNICYLNLMHLQ